jgi:hypothetical protein
LAKDGHLIAARPMLSYHSMMKLPPRAGMTAHVDRPRCGREKPVAMFGFHPVHSTADRGTRDYRVDIGAVKFMRAAYASCASARPRT